MLSWVRMKIAGIDEVGRGAWAGPLCVAAVVLDSDKTYPYCDSKTLTRSKREDLNRDVLQCASFVHIEMVRPQRVDQIGLGGAMKEAMSSCIDNVSSHADHIVIDGTADYARDYSVSSEAIVKADNHIPAVSAASIVAKVHRDAYMRILAKRYPLYGLSTNVGYGTKNHIHALKEVGVEWFHRQSYKPIYRLQEQIAGHGRAKSPLYKS